ncbi:OLC1v1013527C1 [Oldenlandia corymbosa var. corymbosa]|uniref:OLC1v1013527C1 n=1 Tax=Oldenlandia corymbosa var. corymbosa TaxID=529605 RepID=A0AAV1DYX6_OLDCO|nr:OLC1v1013527C1 [Oldenlandia corymbosa var. corymbosa]
MGSASSSLLRSLPSPFPPENPSLSLSLKPHLEKPPSQLPLLPFVSSPLSQKPHQIALNPLQNPPPSNPVPVPKNPFSFSPCLDSSVSPVSVDSVICPSLAYANVYFYKPYSVQVVPRDEEDGVKLAKRFMYSAAKAGVFYEMKRRRFFQNPQEKMKTKSQRAAKLLKRSKMRAGGGLKIPKNTIRRDPLEEKKRKARLAAKRPPKHKRAGFQQKMGVDQNSLSAKKENYCSDDDNWEVEGIEVPYC